MDTYSKEVFIFFGHILLHGVSGTKQLKSNKQNHPRQVKDEPESS